jgi:adenylate kinase family enzyme
MQARANGEKIRADDNEEALCVRLTAYANQTKPLTDYYAAKGLLRTIDASQPVDRVTRGTHRSDWHDLWYDALAGVIACAPTIKR